MHIKCKATTDLSFPKFNINVKKDKEFVLDPKQYRELSIFQNVRFIKLDTVTEDPQLQFERENAERQAEPVKKKKKKKKNNQD